MQIESLDCFKAYDIRGRVPDQLNEDIAYRIGRSFAEFQKAKKVVVGHDIRISSIPLKDAVVRGLIDGGCNVFNIGLCGTEEVYFATFHQKMDGGIMVTASHNPPDYNGMKLVQKDSRPISGDSGLFDIKRIAEAAQFEPVAQIGCQQNLDTVEDYIAHLLGYVDVSDLKPLKIVVNAGNGGAGKIVDLLEPRLPFEFIKIHHDPDGSFPNGVPNPLIPENRTSTIEAIKKHRADLGIAWDGDFDRCFLFDGSGRFIEGYYIVGLLASAFLAKDARQRIVHDPRLTWNTVDIVTSRGGTPIQSKTGHAFIKERMRAEDAVYGGEMSAHHYFRDFSYCDSGMIPWLLVCDIISKSGYSLAQLVDQRMELFPASGEINRRLKDPTARIDSVQEVFKDSAIRTDFTDGLSMEFGQWRFNLRCSNTEPLVRLNVESRGDESLMREKTEQILALLDG